MTDTPWDPTPRVTPSYLSPADGRKWAEKHWLNVPGPFYTGETDTCWTGRMRAPRNVLYGGEYFNEFVYRQPKTEAEVECLLEAAGDDPLGGYACDGDARWTPDAVRAWWNARDKVEEHVAWLVDDYASIDRPACQEAAEGARDFLAYLAGDLRSDLRAYLFRLEHGRYPVAGDQLPDL